MEKWVVVVDDDIVNLKRTGTILSESGIHATAIKSGRALLDFLKSNTPDLILLDVMMPEMDGLETLRRLRQAQGPAACIPVIMITADENPGTRTVCFQLGAVDYIQKPYDADSLIIKIRDAFTRAESLDSSSPGKPNPREKADLGSIITVLENQEAPAGRVWMGKEALTNTYRYMLRYMERYHGIAFQVLFTVNQVREDTSKEEHCRILESFRDCLQQMLRSSDMLFEIGDSQLFLLLPEAHDYDIDRIISRLLEAWHRSEDSRKAVITYEAREMRPDSRLKQEESAGYPDAGYGRV